jgi:diketogulonate reductase-like aldo/keto reductase
MTKANIPILGYGTWDVRGSEGQQSIEHALKVGYRHIDTADWYKNHDIVGAAIKASGIPRAEIYLVTKIFPPLGKQKIMRDAKRFLKELDTEYIDLLLIHWPDNTPVMETLEGMQELKEEGIIRNIGVSNFDEQALDEAFSTGIEIINNQIEIYPGHSQKRLVEYCQQNDISVTAYSPLGQAKSLDEPVVKEIAETYGKSPAQVILNWLMAKDIIVIPKASSPEHIEENWESQGWEMEEDDMRKLDMISIRQYS